MNETKKIELTQGKFAIVNASDYENAMMFKWFYQGRSVKKVSHLQGYAVRNLRLENGKRIIQYLHHYILGISRETKVTFINGNSLDLRRENLLIGASYSEIQMHKKNQINKNIKYKGVDYHKKSKRYRARIKKDSQVITIGHFQNPVDAAKAYDAKAKELFGDLARTNYE